MNYPTDTVLCRENTIEDTFYLILEGEVEVTKVINNDQTRLLKTLTAGDFFGEMALIHNAPRAATVKTLTPLIALEIHRQAFDQVLKNSSSVSLAMVREISRVCGKMTRWRLMTCACAPANWPKPTRNWPSRKWPVAIS